MSRSGWSRRSPLTVLRTVPLKASDYLAEFTVSEEDEAMSLGRFVVTFVVFVFLLEALLADVLLVWATTR